MANEVRASPVELVRFAATMLTASQRLGDAWRAAQRSLSPMSGDFGDTAGSPPVHERDATTAEAAQTAVDRLVAVLEADVDAVYRIAFAYEQADLQAQDELERRRGRF